MAGLREPRHWPSRPARACQPQPVNLELGLGNLMQALATKYRIIAPDLRGYEGDTAPNLAIAKAYSFEAFTRLMREGITLTGHESATGLMTMVARSRFSAYTDDELVALKTYLDQREP